MFNPEVLMFVIYLAFMLGIGVWFFFKSKNGGEKTYFLGGRQMGPWVSALSAGASDMSAWVLMGLPGAIFAVGLGEVWIAVGLGIGYTLSWLFQAPRLRRFSIVANDSITIPQYLTNRFLSKSLALQIICAVVFLVAYTIYAASSIKACGTLFSTVINGLNETTAMYIAALIIIAYTFLGGFSAVCWTDFFQGLLILAAMLIAPLFVVITGEAISFTNISTNVPGFWNAFGSWKSIVSGLAWGIGYFGMPHIIIRFMSVRSQKELKKSAKIGIMWTVIILLFAAIIGIVGRAVPDVANSITDNNELVFINMVRKYFPAILSGILLSAVLAASMSTADSQLLAASSAFASDVYKPIIRKNKSSDREMLWAGRIVVLIISVIAVLIASNPNASSIMGLVSNAWGVFGAAFGPTIMLSLFWKRFNFAGAIAGILSGAIVDILWLAFLPQTGIYEILPGAVVSLIVAIVVTLATKKPAAEIVELYEKAISTDAE